VATATGIATMGIAITGTATSGAVTSGTTPNGAAGTTTRVTDTTRIVTFIATSVAITLRPEGADSWRVAVA
jgi:hypothetical protein